MESGKTGTWSLSWSPGCGRHTCAVPYFDFDLVTCVYYLWSADVGGCRGCEVFVHVVCISCVVRQRTI